MSAGMKKILLFLSIIPCLSFRKEEISGGERGLFKNRADMKNKAGRN